MPAFDAAPTDDAATASPDAAMGPDAGGQPEDGDGGGCCGVTRGGDGPRSLVLATLVGLLLLRSRRRSRS